MKKVYISFATDIIHNGHINIINKAAEFGEIIAGVQTDDIVMSTLRYPILPLKERMEIIEKIKGVSKVVIQDELCYDKVLRELKPDYVVHGDDWKTNYLKGIRQRVIDVLKEWGGELKEFPYTRSKPITDLENAIYDKLGVPEIRRARLKEMLNDGQLIRVMEAHSGLSALIVENAKAEVNGAVRQFDAMWLSSLCDSTVKGKPDIELVDMTSRIRTLEEIMDVTTKPIILDGDTGGQIEHFVHNIRTLERIGVSAIIIEDKVGLKKNSLFGVGVNQKQDTIESFSEKIKAGKRAQRTNEFMIFARCESLILEQGYNDAIERCTAYVKAGADGIMIHSKNKSPDEVIKFCDAFKPLFPDTPIIAVPTTYNTITEEELNQHGINIVIHANQLIRSAFPSMKRTAETILQNGRSYETNDDCMPIKEILTLIPET